jgi:hypothetical protein
VAGRASAPSRWFSATSSAPRETATCVLARVVSMAGETPAACCSRARRDNSRASPNSCCRALTSASVRAARNHASAPACAAASLAASWSACPARAPNSEACTCCHEGRLSTVSVTCTRASALSTGPMTSGSGAAPGCAGNGIPRARMLNVRVESAAVPVMAGSSAP